MVVLSERSVSPESFDKSGDCNPVRRIIHFGEFESSDGRSLSQSSIFLREDILIGPNQKKGERQTMLSILPEKKDGRFPYLIWGRWESGRTEETGTPFSLIVPGPEGPHPWRYALGDRQTISLLLEELPMASRVMGSMTRHRRARILSEVARLLEINREALARLLVCEVGKPISAARFEVDRCATTFLLASQMVADFGNQLIPGDIVPQGTKMTGMVERLPIGPVLAITPYNFPLNLLAHKLAPALAAGCPVIVKPAPRGALSALALGRILLSAGLPPEAMSVIPCGIPEVLSMVDAPGIPVVSFTGSAEVGWSLRDRVPRKQVLLELGGNAAAVILKDAPEEGLVDRLMTGAFAYSGQVCISIQRILVEQSRYESFLEKFVTRVQKMMKEGGIGDPGEATTLMGPLISEAHAQRVHEKVLSAVSRGASSSLPITRSGALLSPVILSGTDENDPIEQEEVFGPVVTVNSFESPEEAIKRVNHSRFGIQASIMTGSLEKGILLAGELEVGGVLVNEIPTFRLDHWPYGGVKESGKGWEGVAYAMEEMTRPRLLAYRLHG